MPDARFDTTSYLLPYSNGGLHTLYHITSFIPTLLLYSQLSNQAKTIFVFTHIYCFENIVKIRTLDMDDMVIEIKGQQRLGQLSKKALHNDGGNVDIVQCRKVDLLTCKCNDKTSITLCLNKQKIDKLLKLC